MSGPSRVQHVVTSDQAGQRLDRVLVDLPGVGSRRRARTAIESGKVLVGGQHTGVGDAGRRVEAGTRIELDWSRPGTARALVRAARGIDRAGLAVLFEDPHLIAVNKPAGLLTDTASRRQALERDSVRKRLHAWLKAQGQVAHIIHRLDRDTSGVVLVARTEAAAADLRRQLRAHRPERVYHVLVHGAPSPTRGTWEDWMAWDKRRLLQRQAAPEQRGAVLASAHFRVLERYEAATLLEVRLVTGRRNQIRLHCQLRGHPLVGETLYLPEDWTPRRPILPRQALHAARLVVLHPEKRKPVGFEAPHPPDLHELLERLRRSAPRP